jgi:hypothetical protein
MSMILTVLEFKGSTKSQCLSKVTYLKTFLSYPKNNKILVIVKQETKHEDCVHCMLFVLKIIK